MKKPQVIILIASIITITLFASISFNKSEKQTNVFEFAQEIIEQYRLKNTYANLYKTKQDLIAASKEATPLGFGAKSFYITKNDATKKECHSYLKSNNKNNLSLISITINNQELSWGKGLPPTQDVIKNNCKTKNKIIWQFS